MSISEARASLPVILERVAGGEEVTITRHGRAVAVVVRPDALRARRAERALDAAAEVGDLLDAGRRATLGGRSGLANDRADELAAGVRADRSGT
jgi:prevent-host-death family protein